MWEPLKSHSNYEIFTEYPFNIRSRRKKEILSESILNGYLSVNIDKKRMLKHRLIANQFLKNDDPTNKRYIDHINRNKQDNHLTNLRWVSPSENSFNLNNHDKIIKYEYIETLPDDIFEITTYGRHEIANVYYSEEQDTFYFYNGVSYRVIITCYQRNCPFINVHDRKGKRLQIFINRFKKMYDLV